MATGTETAILGWHFTGPRLRDRRPLPAVGKTLRHNGELGLCESGLHLSRRAIDALGYAPGHHASRVEGSGTSLEGDDKICCSERTVIWRVDAEVCLRAFTRWCALWVIGQWDAPKIVRRFLATGDEEIRVAAWAAARDVVSGSALTAAVVAARAASSAAATDAARTASMGLALTAATDAARDVARTAASAAAWSVSWAAARDEQNTQLEAMLHEARDGRTEWIWEE